MIKNKLYKLLIVIVINVLFLSCGLFKEYKITFHFDDTLGNVYLNEELINNNQEYTFTTNEIIKLEAIPNNNKRAIFIGWEETTYHYSSYTNDDKLIQGRKIEYTVDGSFNNLQAHFNTEKVGHFTINNEKILFTSNKNDKRYLYSMNLDGSNKKILNYNIINNITELTYASQNELLLVNDIGEVLIYEINDSSSYELDYGYKSENKIFLNEDETLLFLSTYYENTIDVYSFPENEYIETFIAEDIEFMEDFTVSKNGKIVCLGENIIEIIDPSSNHNYSIEHEHEVYKILHSPSDDNVLIWTNGWIDLNLDSYEIETLNIENYQILLSSPDNMIFYLENNTIYSYDYLEKSTNIILENSNCLHNFPQVSFEYINNNIYFIVNNSDNSNDLVVYNLENKKISNLTINW